MNKGLSRRSFLKGASAMAMGIAAMDFLGRASIGLAEESDEEVTPVSALDTEIYCIDRFVTKPEQGKEFLEFFMSEYLEKAQSYGMTLKSTLISPPLWLNNASNTVEIVWAISGFNGWANMVNSSRYQQETLAFWREVRQRVISHDRSFFGNESDLEVLGNV